jgi:hypothetical protein
MIPRTSAPHIPQLPKALRQREFGGVPDRHIVVQQRVDSIGVAGQEAVVDGAHPRPDLGLVRHAGSFRILAPPARDIGQPEPRDASAARAPA